MSVQFYWLLVVIQCYKNFKMVKNEVKVEPSKTEEMRLEDTTVVTMLEKSNSNISSQ